MNSLLRFAVPAFLMTGIVLADDLDGDGISDEWELAHFASIASANATTDKDEDGTTDRDEWIAGTDPNNPAERFSAEISRVGGSIRAAVTERAATGAGYQGLARRYEWLSATPGPAPLRWRRATGIIASSGGEFALAAPRESAALLFRAQAQLQTAMPVTPPATRVPGVTSATGYVQYYGNDFSAENIALLAQFDVVVLEPVVTNCTPAVVAELQRRGVRQVLAYISIGEDPSLAPIVTGDGTGPVHAVGAGIVAGNNGVASFYVDQKWNGSAYVTDGHPDTNSEFGSRFVNPNEQWRTLLDTQRIGGTPGLPSRSLAGLAQIAGRRVSDLDTDRTHDFGFDGFFLDTLDTAGPYANAAGYYAWTAPAMRDTVRFIREGYPDMVVFANRGLFFFHPGLVNPTHNVRPYDYTIRPFIHALLVESYFLDSNPANTGISPFFGDNQHNFAQKVIAEANRPDGFSVFSLDYEINRGAALYAQAVTESVVKNGWTTYLAPDGSIGTIGRWVRDHPAPADTAPPAWDSTGSPPFSPTDVPDRIGIQSLAPGPQAGSVIVRWDVARDQTPPVKYNIYRSGTPDFTVQEKYAAVAFGIGDGWAADPTTAACNQTVITGLADGTHFFRVRAEDSAPAAHEEQNTVALSLTLGVTEYSNFVTAITLDGDFAEWPAIAAFPADPDDVTGGANPLDWRECRAGHNASTFFLGYLTDPPATLGVAHNAFLDTDLDRATGYRGGGDLFPLGAEYLLQGGSLYHYTGSGLDWSWAFVATAGFAWTATIAELAIPWAALGHPVALDLLFYADNPSAGGTTIDWYPDNAPQTGGGGAAYRYRR
jgi:hypothetical protein